MRAGPTALRRSDEEGAGAVDQDEPAVVRREGDQRGSAGSPCGGSIVRPVRVMTVPSSAPMSAPSLLRNRWRYGPRKLAATARTRVPVEEGEQVLRLEVAGRDRHRDHRTPHARSSPGRRRAIWSGMLPVVPKDVGVPARGADEIRVREDDTVAGDDLAVAKRELAGGARRARRRSVLRSTSKRQRKTSPPSSSRTTSSTMRGRSSEWRRQSWSE